MPESRLASHRCSILVGLALASLSVEACKVRSSDATLSEYTSPAANELRLNWYTNRERNYFGSESESEFTARVSALMPSKGVITVDVPSGYRFGEPVVADPPLSTDDNGYNQELVFGSYEPAYEKRATVFVHGFNNTAEDAFSRAAQLFAALAMPPEGERGYRAKSFAFSWPSLGRAVDDLDIPEWIKTGQPFYARPYRRDEQAAAASLRPMADFLYTICGPRGGYERVNVVAHSLGARLASETLAALSRSFQSQMSDRDPRAMSAAMPCRIDNLVLASGDIGIFRLRQILPDLMLITNRITLYVNATLIEQVLRVGVTADMPLALSKLLHFFGGFELGPRAGQQSVFLGLLDERVDIVAMKWLADAPEGGGHFGVFSSPSVLRDMIHLFNGTPSPLRTQRAGLGRGFFILK